MSCNPSTNLLSFLHFPRSLSTGLVANSKAPVSVAKKVIYLTVIFTNLSFEPTDYFSPKGEYGSAEEESRKIWHECFIHFKKGD